MSFQALEIVKGVIGDVWGKLYGKMQSQIASTIKKAQDDYDESSFTFDAQSIAIKINQQREATILQEYGNKGIKFPWDLTVLVFAKEVGVNLPSEMVFWITREVLREDQDIPAEYRQEQLRLLGRMETVGNVVSQSENLGLQEELFNATIPALEFVRFFRELLDLGKREDVIETIKSISDPETADVLLRKRFVDRPPFIDAKGNRIPQPDQPLVGRNNKRLTIATIFGDSPFYQARLQFSLAIAAYYEFLKLEGLSSEAESWLRQRIDFKRYFVFKSEEDINTEISLAVQLNLIRRYWDNLLSDIRKAFYSSRDYSGLASKTQYLLTELEGTPNPIFNRSSLVARILTNIKSAVTFHFVHTFRMTPEDVSQFVSSEAFTNLANDHLTKATESGNFEPFYRQVWTFWHEQRQKFLENKREELSKEFKFAQEQKHAIDSLDTLQKKYYNLITTWFSDPSSKDLVNTGINVLDRAITLLGLELTEVALSHPDITPEHRSEFRNEIITVFSKEMSFLLQKLSPKVDSDTASDVPGVPEGSSPQQGM